jgi:hypothetical protein
MKIAQHVAYIAEVAHHSVADIALFKAHFQATQAGDIGHRQDIMFLA